MKNFAKCLIMTRKLQNHICKKALTTFCRNTRSNKAELNNKKRPTRVFFDAKLFVPIWDETSVGAF